MTRFGTFYRAAINLGLLGLLLAAIALFVFPAVRGVLTLGQRPSWESDQRAIQAAVDAYIQNPTDPARRLPTFSGAPLPRGGVPPLEQRGAPYIDFRLLIGPPPFLNEPPRSAGWLNASGIYTGTYNWFIDADGKVNSLPERSDVYP
ncbi:MAG: hypothetical protein RMM58_11500 [Chloroflexota bacterium]|nr:hypothetical protein [Dehalococcoidia bacterium]MDW8254489.1 hypothetical protein [Chloroflexota bacterium]